VTLHMIGIGGVSMSGIARILAAQGRQVSGCDRADGPIFDTLRAAGVDCRVGHHPSHLAGVDEVCVSTAIGVDEPELRAARDAGIRIRHRAELLADIIAPHAQRIVVTGAHGKTTTSAMLAVAATTLGLDPTFLVGGDVRQLGTNARDGRGALCIAEGDESDRSVATLPADVAVILNIDLDHLDHYATREDLRRLLEVWSGTLAATATLVVGDGVSVASAARQERFGLGAGEGLRALDVTDSADGVSFRPSDGRGRVRLGVAGIHNAANACAAAAALRAVGTPLSDAFGAIAQFTGAGRRFELVGAWRGALVVDDYAHHPAELAATIRTARAQQPKRLVVYFQPHMPWRTRAFADAFAQALRAADVVVIGETYVARGTPDPDASARRIAALVAADASGVMVTFAADEDDAVAALVEQVRPGDLVVCAGAGPVDRVARRVVAS
jgi:UDP-N-acetylmuramate--alanine ligase